MCYDREVHNSAVPGTARSALISGVLDVCYDREVHHFLLFLQPSRFSVRKDMIDTHVLPDRKKVMAGEKQNC